MTDKKTEIQEMANIFCCIDDGSYIPCVHCGYYDEERGTKCPYYSKGKALIEFLKDAGYRKADEVRKETAKKVLYELRDCFCEMTAYAVGEIVDEDYTEIGVTNVIDIIDVVLKKYGVEVD